MTDFSPFQIGGSLTGLMHGIMLHSQGHNVHIIEQTPSPSRTDHAAGITAQPQVVEYFRRHGFSKDAWSIPCPAVQFLDAKATVKRTIKKPLDMTSWSVLYDQLRGRFESLQKKSPSEKLKAGAGPTATWSFGRRATNVAYDGDKVEVGYEDLAQGQRGILNADLVLVADGAGSTIRQTLLPATERTFSGYVAWRGTVTEDDVSHQTKKIFDSRLTYFAMKKSYILWFVQPSASSEILLTNNLKLYHSWRDW